MKYLLSVITVLITLISFGQNPIQGASELPRDQNVVEVHYDKPLKLKLEAIYDSDQTIRQEYLQTQKQFGFRHKIVDSLGVEMNKIDSINHKEIVAILDSIGWVGSDIVGKKGNQALFLVIQHADLEIQKKYLPMMRTAVTESKANPASLALLEDRVALREGRHQIYGSQIGRHPETNEPYVLPLNDPDNVDARRASMGLGTMSEYTLNWGLEWDISTYKKMLPQYEAIAKQKK